MNFLKEIGVIGAQDVMQKFRVLRSVPLELLLVQ